MFKLKKSFLVLNIILFSCLGLLFIVNNKQVMGMNNGNINQNNRNINAIMEEFRNLHDLLLEEARLINQIYNAIRNNDSEEKITILNNQANGIALQAENIRRNINSNQN
ncbi:Conserved hypothetical protein [Candidatus Phytoplasma australiense]|uniref:Sequence-variable mosaic (SVM) signal sequence domain-containing protein n=1 Tax=Phytoplasma australiense TaxID=59748 RepID=B1VA28_PHYAS|nr:Conserved hypothetical protein [Candidatus Phytoplasma australiense]